MKEHDKIKDSKGMDDSRMDSGPKKISPVAHLRAPTLPQKEMLLESERPFVSTFSKESYDNRMDSGTKKIAPVVHLSAPTLSLKEMSLESLPLTHFEGSRLQAPFQHYASLVSMPSSAGARAIRPHKHRTSLHPESLRVINNTVAELLKEPVAEAAQYDDAAEESKLKGPDKGRKTTRWTVPPLQQETSYKGLYFDDGKRRIDFVLAYEQKTDNKGEDEQEKKKSISRKKFLMGLLRAGVNMERAIQIAQSSVIYYIKLHLPFPLLCAYAEDLNFRVPLEERPENDQAASGTALLYRCFRIANPHQQSVPNKPVKYFTCKFKTTKRDRFYGGNQSSREETFFTATQRSHALFQILQTTSYGKRVKGEVGIETLIEEGVFNAAYALHDGEKEWDKDCEEWQQNKRAILWKYWASYGKWYKNQPFSHIREYYGEKIGIYFVWLGFYTKLLVPAAIVGVLVFIYGIFAVSENGVVNELCNSGKSIKMCPPCDECESYYLSDLCWFVRIGYLFDHPGTVFYSIFMSFWAVIFLKFWKRQAAATAFEWDCWDYNVTDERPTAEYMNMAPKKARNPITNQVEPYFPEYQRFRRVIGSCTFLLFMMGIVFLFILACIIYKVLVSIYLAQLDWKVENLKQYSGILAILSGTVINLILIVLMGCIYELLALKLTRWEMHRTQTEFENAYTVKVFVFQFVNYFSSIFYVAFFKGKFVGYPGNYFRFLGLRNEECSSGGCMIELAQQLLVIMVGKQVFDNVSEVVIPRLQSWWQTRLIIKSTDDKSIVQRWEADYQLLAYPGLFAEYLETTLQFGFITVFVAACPLAPLLALINNWVEVRLDAKKLVSDCRRPITERAQNIGVWAHILTTIAHIAVISNGFLIAFTSSFITQSLYQHTVDENLKGYVNFSLAISNHYKEPCFYSGFRNKDGELTRTYWQLLAARLAFVVAFEHFVFVIIGAIHLVVPDVPKSLDIAIKREQYLAKQALVDTQTALLIAATSDDEDD